MRASSGAENVCRRDRILNREVYTDAAYGRHGVGRIANTRVGRASDQRSRRSIDGEEFELIPIGNFVDAIGQKGLCDLVAQGVPERFEPDPLSLTQGIHDKAGLVVVIAIDQDQELARD